MQIGETENLEFLFRKAIQNFRVLGDFPDDLMTKVSKFHPVVPIIDPIKTALILPGHVDRVMSRVTRAKSKLELSMRRHYLTSVRYKFTAPRSYN